MKKIPLSKLFLILLFLNFFALEIFIGFITLKSFAIVAITQQMDFTPLVTLIGAIMGQTLSYGIYSAKSKAENTVNGIVYDTAMKELERGEEDYGTYNQEDYSTE